MSEPTGTLESVFLAALERATPGERCAYLAEACAGAPDLLRRAQELLAHHEAPRGPLDTPPPGVGPPVDADRPGAVVGPYKLLEQIGEGGMGLVFLAEQLQPVRRRVALKVLKPGLDSRQVVARFE